jgi:hypothetical protein
MRWLRCEYVTVVPGSQCCGPENWDQNLVEALNDPSLSPYTQKVAHFITSMQCVEKQAMVLRRHPWHEDRFFEEGDGAPEEIREAYKSYSYLLHEINAMLRSYSGTRYFPNGVGAFGWTVTWRDRRDEETRGEGSLWQQQSLSHVLSVAARGSLNRIRTCARCERWFFARVSHQNFCSDKCRLQHFAEKPEFKEKRRRYMAEYRRLEKRRQERSRVQAARRSQRG